MDCRDTKRLLWQYLDQEMDPATHRAVTDHLDECDRCLARFRGEESVELGLSRSLLSGAPTPRLWSRIDAALDAADSQIVPKARPRRRPLVWAAAAAALLLAGAFLLWDDTEEGVAPQLQPDFYPEVAKLHDRIQSNGLGPEKKTSRLIEIDEWAKLQADELGFHPDLAVRDAKIPGLLLEGADIATLRGEQSLVVYARLEAADRLIPIHLVILKAGSVERFGGTSAYLASGKTRERQEGWVRVAARQSDRYLVAAVGAVEERELEPFVESLFDILVGKAVVRPAESRASEEKPK